MYFLFTYKGFEMTTKVFATKITPPAIFTWEAYDKAFKEAVDNGKLIDSKYPIIRDAKKDKSSDIIYVCYAWVDPPRGVCVSTRSYGEIFQNGEQTNK